MRARLQVRRVAEEQDGFTLVELLVVLAIVGVILAGITQLLTSALKSQNDQTNRTQAQRTRGSASTSFAARSAAARSHL